ncbi:unnamed protein product [Timema podura]|uniref:Uncharacterized protein n=1 Tax=Timema podura TaxID=61482 RepID=A0ABN7NGW0_TIMPD|nr:unnamed protein product [Timema podura]
MKGCRRGCQIGKQKKRIRIWKLSQVEEKVPDSEAEKENKDMEAQPSGENELSSKSKSSTTKGRHKRRMQHIFMDFASAKEKLTIHKLGHYSIHKFSSFPPLRLSSCQAAKLCQSTPGGSSHRNNLGQLIDKLQYMRIKSSKRLGPTHRQAPVYEDQVIDTTWANSSTSSGIQDESITPIERPTEGLVCNMPVVIEEKQKSTLKRPFETLNDASKECVDTDSLEGPVLSKRSKNAEVLSASTNITITEKLIPPVSNKTFKNVDLWPPLEPDRFAGLLLLESSGASFLSIFENSFRLCGLQNYFYQCVPWGKGHICRLFVSNKMLAVEEGSSPDIAMEATAKIAVKRLINYHYILKIKPNMSLDQLVARPTLPTKKTNVTSVHSSSRSDNKNHSSSRSDNKDHSSSQSDNKDHSSSHSDDKDHYSSRSDNKNHSSSRSDNKDHSSSRSDNKNHSSSRSDNMNHSSSRSDNKDHSSSRSDNKDHSSSPGIGTNVLNNSVSPIFLSWAQSIVKHAGKYSHNLVFSPLFSREELDIIKRVGQKADLRPSFRGNVEGEDLQLVLGRDIWTIARELLRVGGHNDKYQLIPPRNMGTSPSPICHSTTSNQQVPNPTQDSTTSNQTPAELDLKTFEGGYCMFSEMFAGASRLEQDRTRTSFDATSKNRQLARGGWNLEEIYWNLCGGGVKNRLGKTTFSTLYRDVNPSLPVIDNPVYCKCDALDHAATEVAHMG